MHSRFLTNNTIGTSVFLLQAPTQRNPNLPHRHRHRHQASNNGFESSEKGSEDTSVDFEQQFQSAAKALQALEDYKILMQQPEPDLLTGAILIARHRHPDASLTTANEILDDLAQQIIPKLPESRYPLKIIETISEHLYGKDGEACGFEGAADYYSPDNSCINFVLDERQGIPITLSLMYLEVAKRCCGFELLGVNVPGHFFLTPADLELEFFIDCYNGGQVTFLADAEETLEKIIGGRKVKLDPGFLQRKDQIASRVFFTRMLNNLKAIYSARKDYLAALSIQCYLRATRPGDLDEIREYGYILYHLKRYAECSAALTEYLERAPDDATDVVKVRKVLQNLRGAYDGDDLSCGESDSGGKDSGMDN
jgi:regulator of sirC expression with transglutaminase-like and TPR domain